MLWAIVYNHRTRKRLTMEQELRITMLYVWERFVLLYPELRRPCPALIISNRLKTTVGYNRPEDRTVTMAAKLWAIEANRAEIVEHWIPHEIAHQVDYDLHGYPKGNRWHGPTWQRIMRRYGLEPTTYHNLILP